MKPRRQSGAVLVIGLILLSILTVLATSTVSTAALELMMAGNDQYQNHALLAAETGIERAIASGAFDSAAPETTLDATLSNGDSYTVAIRPRGSTAPPAPYNNTFTAEHFEIESTGVSHRDAKAAVVQGLFLVRAPGAVGPMQAASSVPPLCLTGVEIRPRLCVDIGTPVRTYWRPRVAP